MTNFLKQNKDIQDDRFSEKIDGRYWLGIVIDSNDELFLGRCKIRVFEKFDELSDEDLPWAFPNYSHVFAGGESKGCGSFSFPKIGTLVRVKFESGDIYAPEYELVQNLNKKMQGEMQGSYENCQFVSYDEDEDMKIIYTQNGGLLMWHKESYMRIDKDKHITIEHAGSPSIQTFKDGNIYIKSNTDIIEESPMIHLDSPDTRLGPDNFESGTRCESLMQLLTQLAAMIDAKIPITGGAAQALVSANQPLICSMTVDIAQ